MLYARNHPNVLLLYYEDPVTDLEAQLPLITDFMGIPELDAELLELVLERSSRLFMTDNVHLFNEKWLKDKIKRLNRCPGRQSTKMRPAAKVTHGIHREKLYQKGQVHVKELWTKHVTPDTG